MFPLTDQWVQITVIYISISLFLKTVSKEQVEEVTTIYETKKRVFDELNNSIRNLKIVCKKQQRITPTYKLQQRINTLKAQNKAKALKLAEMEKESGNLADPEVMAKIEHKHLLSEKYYRERRKIYLGMIDKLCEAKQWKRGKLLSAIGLDFIK